MYHLHFCREVVLFGVHPVLSTLLSRSTSVQHQKILASIPLVGLLVSTVAWFRVCISPEARQKSPNKWYWLGIFTFGEALSIGFFTSLFKFQSVLIAMGATAIATISVSAFTILQKNPKHDLSQWGQTLSSWVMILLAYGFIGLFQQIGWIPPGFIPYSSMMYSFFASCLFSAYLACKSFPL
jgi:FtsH-binding integral membrane protein